MKGTAASKGPADWDQRFAEPGHAYGETVNDFLAGCAQGLPPGAALTLAEGEGRNAVWLAQQGHRVTAVDFSATGRDKALTMAMRAGVMIDYRLGDLADFDPGRGQWDLVAAIFSQPPAPVRRRLHGRLAQALRPGGRFMLEAKAEAGGISENEMRDRMTSGTHLRSFVTAADIAHQILFLCSDAGCRITGQSLSVDAGLEGLT